MMKRGRWARCLRAPLRLLGSVRDLYIKGMNGCAGRVQCGAGLMAPSLSEFSYSYEFNSAWSCASDEGLRELTRAASVRRTPSVRRSQSVAVGRIDEDAPSEFKDDVKVGTDLLFPRSRSYAAVRINRTRKVFD